MAPTDDTNGALKAPKSASPASRAKGRVVRRVRAPPKPQQTVLARRFNAVARIFTWYAILTILFRCPATLSECDDTSPGICRPYFLAKQTASPYVEPLYNAYAAPYVRAAKPYYESVDRAVLAPAWSYAVKYGVPQLQQARSFGVAQYDHSIRPQLAKAHAALSAQYATWLAPHVDVLSATVSPYYAIARASALQTHHDVILPTAQLLAPYAVQGYSSAVYFVTDSAVPSTVWVWNQTVTFLDTNVWPRLQVLYVDTVEPQLERIGQRLGRYSKNSQLESALKSTATSSFKMPASVSTATAVSSTSVEPTPSAEASSTPAEHLPDSTTASSSSTASVVTSSSVAAASATSVSSQQPPQQPGTTEAARLKGPEPIQQDQPEENESDERRVARETVAEDLKAWQEKYAKAADEGAVEIEKRIDEISRRMIRRQAKATGKSLLDDLQKAVADNLAQLRRDIVGLVGTVKDGATSAEEADELVVAAVRRAGVEVKHKAQAVRAWREEYSRELQDTVSRAAANHFEILGSIRDLALQKIGMKWAWMEGVTYKDWAKYHQLKNRFDEWEQDLEQLIVMHPGLEEAQNAAQAVEDGAMNLAQSAAKELARLKQVGPWKIVAGDVSDDFDSDTMKAAAEAVDAAAAAAAEAKAEDEAAVAEDEDEAAVTEAEGEAITAGVETAEATLTSGDAEAPDDTVIETTADEAETSSPSIEADTDTVSAQASSTLEEPSQDTVSPTPPDDASATIHVTETEPTEDADPPVTEAEEPLATSTSSDDGSHSKDEL